MNGDANGDAGFQRPDQQVQLGNEGHDEQVAAPAQGNGEGAVGGTQGEVAAPQGMVVAAAVGAGGNKGGPDGPRTFPDLKVECVEEGQQGHAGISRRVTFFSLDGVKVAQADVVARATGPWEQYVCAQVITTSTATKSFVSEVVFAVGEVYRGKKIAAIWRQDRKSVV